MDAIVNGGKTEKAKFGLSLKCLPLVHGDTIERDNSFGFVLP